MLGIGSKGELVRELQQILGFWSPLLGFPHPGKVDGVFGRNTAGSSQAFKAIIRESSDNPGRLGETPKWGMFSTAVEYGSWLQRLAAL